MTVRYRRSYLAYKDAAAGERQVQNSLASVLWSPLESTAIPLTARVRRVDNAKPNSLKVSYTVDIHNLQLTQKGDIRKGVIHAIFVQQDTMGNQLETLQEGFNLDLTNENYETYLTSGMTFSRSIDAKGRSRDVARCSDRPRECRGRKPHHSNSNGTG